jgi:sterol desaturase/sphingolipid hydroxylase (fatty acid hydroxylase superfamily)
MAGFQELASSKLFRDGFRIDSFRTWTLPFGVLFALVIWIGMEILSRYVPMLFGSPPLIPVKGKHLDKLEPIDKKYIFINKLLTVCFVYHVIQVILGAESIAWDPEDVTIYNTLGSFVAFFTFYDYFYMWFHYFLHVRWLYPLIHKHHHRQKAPSRGNLDAINVHPFEYVVGEYLHLLTIYLIPSHVYTIAAFIITGGVLASLNHTRLDLNIPFGVYSVKAHDVHHRIPESNYAQYTMYWDKLHGFYRPYDIAAKSKDQ